MRSRLLLALLLYALAPPSAAVPSSRERWVEVRGGTFTLTGNVRPGRARELAEAFARFQGALRILKPGLVHEAPVPLHVFAFDSDRDYAPYREPMGFSESIVGHFFAHRFGQYLVFNAHPSRGGGQEVLYHEYLHAFLANNFPPLPLWINEGLAEYFGSFAVERDAVLLGLPHPQHVRWLRAHSLLPFETLFAVTPDSPEYRGGEETGGFYALSWLLVHYLLTGEPAQAGVAPELLRRFSQGEPADRVLAETLGYDAATLERKLRGYVNQRTFPILRMPASELAEVSLPAPAPISRAEALYRLGSYLALTGHADAAAAAHLEEAVEEVPAAWGALGLLADRAGRPDEALDRYRRGIQRGTDPLATALLADHLLQSAEDPAAVREARAALRSLVASRSGFAEGHALLGLSLLSPPDDDPTAAAGELEEAYRRLPGRPEIAYNLALAYLRTGRRDDAEQLYRIAVAPAGVPELAGELAAALGRGSRIDRLNAVLASGSLAEIRDALEEALAGSWDETTRGELEERRAIVELQLGVQALAAGLEPGVALANSGRLAEAREHFAVIQAELDALVDSQLLRLREATGGSGTLPPELLSAIVSLRSALRDMQQQLGDPES